MKMVLSALLLFTMVGCVSAKTREEGKITCLTVNKTYQNPDDLGFNCKDKLDEKQRDFRFED